MSPLKSKLFSVLSSRQWWLDSLRAAARYAPACFLPAAGLATGNVILLAGTQKLLQILQSQEITSELFVSMATSGGLAILSGFILVSWALASWLVHLTAFSRACLQSDEIPDDASFKRCLQEVRAKKVYLWKVWSVASVYLLVPMFPLSLLSVCRVMSSPEYASLGLESFGPPGWSEVFINLGLVAVIAVIAGYTMMLVVGSAAELNAAGQTAWQAAKLAWTRSGSVLAATAVVLLLNLAISAPQALFSGGSVGGETLNQNLYGYIAWQVWFAFSSAILWPWSVTLFCVILKESGQGQP